MKIVTTPMCQEILRLAGVPKFHLVKNGDYEDADVAVVLSETKVPENTSTRFIKLKLNTFNQITDSIKSISDILNTQPLDESWANDPVNRDENRKIKVKTCSNFLREIAEDVGFTVVTDDSYDYLIYPDYMKEDLKEELHEAGGRAVELPSHGNAPLNPIKRAEIRYQLLENSICMKH